jgi:ATP-binding cassette subfamily B protein
MFKTIRYIAGQNISYLKRPACYSLLEGLCIAAPYGVIALFLPDMLGSSLSEALFWHYYALILLFLGLRAFFAHKGYGGGMRAGYEAGTAVRLNLGEHLRKLSMGFFNDRNTGELANRLFENVGMLEMMISHFFTQAVAYLSTSLFMLIIMFFIYPLMTLVMLLPLILALPLLWGLLKMVGREGEKRIQKIDVANSYILEYLHGITVFKSYNLTGLGFERLAKALEELKAFSIRFEIKGFAVVLSYSALLETGFVLLIMVGIRLVQGGDMDLAALTVFLILSLRFYRPLHRFAENAALTRYAYTGAKAINEVLEVEEIPGGSSSANISKFDIRFDKVSFGYKEKKVIHDISFTAGEHSMTALVGPSGSGKSTLTRLIARFWEVDQGSIMVGGNDIRTISPDVLLGHISMVFQEVYLFNDTVYNNIRIGKDSAEPEEVTGAARIALCHDFIEALPHGYDTVIGEGGATLSGGEKQRIAIARAILKDAPIVLLDEATASLDPENDRLIQAAIDRLVRSKTLIVIAHRLHTIMAADRIVVLGDGEIMQTGTHPELIAQKGWYADMWREQQSEARLNSKRQDATSI